MICSHVYESNLKYPEVSSKPDMSQLQNGRDQQIRIIQMAETAFTLMALVPSTRNGSHPLNKTRKIKPEACLIGRLDKVSLNFSSSGPDRLGLMNEQTGNQARSCVKL
jgi:hypothetical protein